MEKAAWTPEGVVGGAYTFNEVYKYIQVDNTDVLSPEQVTAACWIYPTGHSGYHGALIKSTSGVWGDGYGLTMYSGDSKHIYFFVNAYVYYRVKAPIEMNQWAHLVGTYDGKEVRIYKNGKLIESMAYKAKLKTNTSHLYIGQGRSNGYPWPGAIDEAMLFRRALSAQEVTALYDRFPHP
ncbi:MAG: LamG domain-containing protein [Verrucomicrobiota bacterium]